jgi:frataxin-like iron-binding protein CyaY
MPSDQFEQLLMARLDKLEDKLDKVRTDDIPKIKVDVMAVVTENRSSSKLHAFIGSIIAIVIGAAMPHR